MGYLGQLEIGNVQEFLVGMEGYSAAAEPVRVMQVEAEENRLCCRPGCTKVGRYGLQGLKACGRSCLEAMLRAIVVSEQAGALATDLGAGPKVQLGRILIEQGSITEPQLEQALRAQRATGAGKLGSWLKQQVALSEADFSAALSIQWKCPVFRLGNFAPQRMAFFLPQKLAEKHGALALRITGDVPRISICFEDHIDFVLLRALEQMHGMSAEGGLLTAGDFWQATRALLGAPSPNCSSVAAPSVEEMARAMSHVLLAVDGSDARLVAVGSTFWLRVWQAHKHPGPDMPDLGLPGGRQTFCHGREAARIQHPLTVASLGTNNRVALDVLCLAADSNDAEWQESSGCEHLASQMLAGVGEHESARSA